MCSKLSQWEERLANEQFPRAETLLMLSDWRADRSALIKKLEALQAYHKEEILSYVPRTRGYTIHEAQINLLGALIIALTAEDLSLLTKTV